MKEKTNLLVFDKFEVFMIFVFMILTAIISFTIGVKIGKNYSFEKAGYSSSDKEIIDLKSSQEEDVDALKTDKESKKSNEEVEEINHKKLMEKFNSLDKKNEVSEPEETMEEEPVMDSSNNTVNEKSSVNPNLGNEFIGKYTVQLSSHNNLDEAKKFAEGFKVLGYKPIIREADLESKGIWYRVSLGAFDTLAEAKSFVTKEKSLFQGQDYRFVKID